MKSFGPLVLAALGIGGLLLAGRKGGVLSGTFQERWLAAALRYAALTKGQKEKPGNRGEYPDKWNKANGKALGSSYCGSFLAAVAREVGGWPKWLTLSGVAKVWMAEAQKVGLWISAKEARENPELIMPGYFAVWDRTQPDKPETEAREDKESTWMGHIGLVGTPIVDGEWLGVEANTGLNDVVLDNVARSLSDSRLLGFGIPKDVSA